MKDATDSLPVAKSRRWQGSPSGRWSFGLSGGRQEERYRASISISGQHFGQVRAIAFSLQFTFERLRLGVVANQTKIIRKMTHLAGLDRTDFALMALLQENAWLSTKELAASVGLASSSVHERLKRLRSIGVLRGAHAHIDSAKVGFEIEALLMVEMAKHDRELVDEVLRKLSAIPEVRSVYVISGRFDLVVHVVAKNVRALKDLALDRFTSGLGISKIETSIIFEARHHWGLPIPLD